MRNKRLLKGGFLGLAIAAMLALMAGGASLVQGQELTTYVVQIENLTSGQPFTPPVVVAHSDQIDILEVGQAASEEVRQIAENGNNDPLVALLAGSDAVFSSAVGGGPVMPGASATLSIDAPPGGLLSIVFMLICTNDGFSGVDSMPLPASGSQTVEADAYDAGSEENTEDFADIVPPCQGLIGVSSDDEGTGMSNPALAEGGVISSHPGIEGGNDLTVGDHGWTDPVARITVSVEVVGLPSAGTGPVDDGGATVWLIYLGAGGAMLLALGGAIRLARRRAAR